MALAHVLQDRGLITAPESIIKLDPTQDRRIPDVLVEFMGLRIAIEGEVDDQADAELKALASASRRVEDGIAHIGIAVVYPENLRRAGSIQALKDELAGGDLSMAVVSESGPSGFRSGAIDSLETELRAAFDALVREDVVTEAAEAIDDAVTRFAFTVVRKRGIIERLAEALEMSELSDDAEAGEPEED